MKRGSDATRWIIDGYNLLHAAGLGREHYGPGDLQRARDALVRRVASLLDKAELTATIIVFDARDPPPHLPHRWRKHGLTVLFAPPDAQGDADAVIEELINQHPAPRQLTVVSSDHRVEQAARRRKAACVESVEFLLRRPRVEAKDTKEEVLPEKPAGSAADAAHWAEVFGDVVVGELDLGPAPVPPREEIAPLTATNESASAPEPDKRGRAHKKAMGMEDEKAPSDEASPYSSEWMADLQKWADEEQRRAT